MAQPTVLYCCLFLIEQGEPCTWPLPWGAQSPVGETEWEREAGVLRARSRGSSPVG